MKLVMRCAGLASVLCGLLATPAVAADGEILLSQDKAMTGNVTPGDAAGFPITLTQPGRYRLVGNLLPPNGVDGIDIQSDNVTVDFDGFTLQGDSGAGTGVSSRRDAIEIMNGVITGFGLFGIQNEYVGRFWAISNMRVMKNGKGVSAGAYARVVGNTIAMNGDYGLACEFCLIQGNVVALNHDDGIDARGATVLGNAIAGNRGYGISSFVMGYATTGYGNNTLVRNNGSGHLSESGHMVPQSPQVNGWIETLQPNVQ
jgi:hypothetical protein